MDFVTGLVILGGLGRPRHPLLLSENRVLNNRLPGVGYEVNCK